MINVEGSELKLETLEERTERQLQLEQQYRTRSLERSRSLVQKAMEAGKLSTLPPVQRMIAAAYDTVEAGINSIKAEKSAGIGGKYRQLLRMVPTNVLAVMSLTTCFESLFATNTFNSRNTAQSVLSQLGRQVQAELLSIKLDAVAPAYMNRVYEYLKERNTTSPSHIFKTLRASAENVHYQHELWPSSQSMAVGKLLMQAVWETGLFEWHKASDASQLTYLAPASELAVSLQELVTNADTVNLKPPMLVPPLRHDTMFSGGYLTNLCRRGTYHNGHINRAKIREVAEAFKQAPELQQALNKAQEVPYCINKDMLELLNEARKLGVGTGMPSTVPAPRPEWRLDGVPKEQYDERTLEDFQGWKVQMREWHNQERTRVGQLRALMQLVQICEEFKDEEQLYFPTCVDWRYRLYFKSSLHPQGSDVQKAMLQFGRKKPLGDRGLFWLKVHVSTCYGYDKALFEERAAWADANIQQIREVAQRPFDAEAFRSADSPWCFLAACRDLVAALDSPVPELYESAIPVAMDATNSGSQHFAAMLRDPVAGQLTNLYWTGNTEKADMYMDVKVRTDESVISAMTDIDSVVQADFWRKNEITRSMCKRPCMTYTYSATVRSCAEYIYLAARESGYEGLEEFSIFKLSSWLAPRMRSAVEAANPKAAEAMRYMQQITGRIPTKQHMQWLTPLGGLVVNRYCENETTRVSVKSMGLTHILCYNRDFDTNNRRKSKSGIAPNAIHSMDATHLMRVINAFPGDIMPIHDSVATHACDVDAMHKHIRAEFVGMYTEGYELLDVLAEAAVKAGADLEGLEMPEKGTLNLELVKESPLFFC